MTRLERVFEPDARHDLYNQLYEQVYSRMCAFAHRTKS